LPIASRAGTPQQGRRGPTRFSLLPDVDSLAGLIAGDFGRYHNNATHSLLVAAGVSLGFAGIMAWKRQSFGFWFLVAVACYGAHVLMDSATPSRGVMAFWPITGRRFHFPLQLFYGFRWSDGWFSVHHVWTVVTELGFAALAALLTLAVDRRTTARD
jgi:inner membrane protein